MPYNPDIHAVQVLSKQHKQMLAEIAAAEKRGLQAQAELLIERAYNKMTRKQ